MTVSNLKPTTRVARKVHLSRQTRVGWFSTWNSRCGIAEYSKYLLSEFDTQRFDWTVLASRNDVLVVPDEGRVIRCWTNSQGSVSPLLDVVLRERFDFLLIQFKVQADFGFLSLHQLEALIACCHCVGTRVVMILHATDGADPAGRVVTLRRIALTLSTVDRILVHSRADLERLRAFGVDGNVELFPHGYIDPGPYDRMACRQAQQLPQDAVIIGSHGFLLPQKGIDKLIETLALLRASGKRAKLLLVNALYPIPASEEHLALCRRMAAEHGILDDVVFETRFLPYEVSLKLLAACDVIVYPYQSSAESVSGAVRLGLAARRPVMCSPLPIFSDVCTVVHFLRGFGAEDICADLQDFLSDEERRERLTQRQAEWVEQHSWQRVAQLLQEKLEQPVSKRAQRERRTRIAHYVLDVQADHEIAEKAAQARLAEAKAQIAAVENNAKAQIAAVENNAKAQIAAAENEKRTKIAETENSARTRIAELEQSLLHWQNTAESTAQQVQHIYNSTSWRITKPLRRSIEMSRALRRTLANLLASRQPAEPMLVEQACHTADLDLSSREQAIYLDLKRAIERNKLR